MRHNEEKHIINRSDMMSKEIQEALENCAAYAERGYRLAKAGYDEVHDAVLEEEGKLQEAKYEQKRSGRLDYGDTLDKQMRELRVTKELEDNLRRDLQSLRERQKEFSVVVFGRTMAGNPRSWKSCVMAMVRASVRAISARRVMCATIAGRG